MALASGGRLQAVGAFPQVPIEQLRAFDQEVAMMFESFYEHGDAGSGGPDRVGLRQLHPGLMTLADCLRETGWKPAPARVAR